jgi:type I restriction enzyme S subunit
MKQVGALSLPKGWEVKRLPEVVEFHRGLTYSKKDEVDFSDNIVLRSNNVDLKTNKLDFTELKYINPNVLIPQNKKVTKGSLLICTANGSKSHLGKVALIDDDYNYAFGGFMGLIKPMENLNSNFLFYFMISESYKKFISALSDGSNINNLKFGDFEEFKIPLPPLQEQQRIVTILDEAFTAIDKAKANTEQNLKNAKELFESELQRVFSEKGDGWEEKRLKDISITFGRGKSKHRPRNDKSLYDGDYPFIQTGDIRNCDHYITEYSQTYNEKGLAQSKLWKKGTICITIAANIAETGVLNFDACFPDSVIGIEVNEKFADRNFVEYLLQSFKVKIQSLGKGSAQANINMGTFENELFPFPSVKQQQTIVTKLDALREQTKKLEAVYEQKLQDLEELKKSVLQKAFSGEL